MDLRYEATLDQRRYLQALSSQLAGLICVGDPLASRIAREALLSNLDRDYADKLIKLAEDAIRVLEDGNVTVGPWGAQYA